MIKMPSGNPPGGLHDQALYVSSGNPPGYPPG